MTRNLADQILHAEANRPSVKQRMAEGKALRQTIPRDVHGDYAVPADRQDPIKILETQAETRLPFLVPVRYARMLASPFAYLRGAAATMISDIAPAPTTGLEVTACGDMHVANFGVFASAERNLVFGINDFDEGHRGAWEWDLKRLVASAVVAGRFLGGNERYCNEAARAAVKTYRKALREYAHMGYMELWYANINEKALLEALPAKNRKQAAKTLSKARQRTHLQVLDKMTDLVDNQQRIVEIRPLIVRETKTALGTPLVDALRLSLQDYMASLSVERQFLLSRYHIVDIARKVVGVGSVGTRCWMIYLQGRDSKDPLFLQLKEARLSVLEPYAAPTVFENQGQRVVTCQRQIQGAPDIFLGWGEWEGIQFYVRQLRDMKGSAEFKQGDSNFDLSNYCKLCGWALALAHAKSGDPARLAGYVGKSEELDEALVRFGNAYADQTERDYELLQAAAAQGRIPVAEGDVL
ncbi:DUF2252 domain-containing protein [bacterium]|nr:DUF2252 domain-containing protein [bacterium]